MSPEPSPGSPLGVCVPARDASARRLPLRVGKLGLPPAPAGTGGSGVGLVGRPAPSLALRGPGAPGHDPTATQSLPGGAAALRLFTLRGWEKGTPNFPEFVPSRKTHVS